MRPWPRWENRDDKLKLFCSNIPKLKCRFGWNDYTSSGANCYWFFITNIPSADFVLAFKEVPEFLYGFS
jgi:hypothetical protein